MISPKQSGFSNSSTGATPLFKLEIPKFCEISSNIILIKTPLS